MQMLAILLPLVMLGLVLALARFEEAMLSPGRARARPRAERGRDE